jgi:hypothetical protein
MSLILVGLANPGSLLMVRVLPQWARDLLLWYIEHNWGGLWDAANLAMEKNDCLLMRFTIWGNIFEEPYRNGWCTGEY